jgi:tetratricopeptide (TPR) repeat protein
MKMLVVCCGLAIMAVSCGKDTNVRSQEAVKQGFQFYKNNEYDKAIEAYKRAIEYNPGNAMAHYYLGVVYKDYTKITDNRVAAVKEMEAAIVADMTFMDPYIMLASMYMNEGKFEEVETITKRAIKAKYDEAEPHYWLAQSYSRRMMFYEAREECKRALKINPAHEGCRQLLVEVEQSL